jgi:hypothetical protein
VSEVDHALGAPDYVFPDPDSWAVHFVYEDLGLAGVLIDADRDRHADAFEQVALVVALEPFSGTYQGVGLGSTREAVLSVMGPSESVDGDDYWYPSRGIVWTVKDGAVVMLGVFLPDLPGKGRESRSERS